MPAVVGARPDILRCPNCHKWSRRRLVRKVVEIQEDTVIHFGFARPILAHWHCTHCGAVLERWNYLCP